MQTETTQVQEKTAFRYFFVHNFGDLTLQKLISLITNKSILKQNAWLDRRSSVVSGAMSQCMHSSDDNVAIELLRRPKNSDLRTQKTRKFWQWSSRWPQCSLNFKLSARSSIRVDESIREYLYYLLICRIVYNN